jgi:hypothetical protein
MKDSFLSGFSPVTIALTLFFVILITYWIASRISKNNKNKENISKGFGPVEGALLGLLSLLLAFTFNMSAARYDMRRQIVIEEANDIGTAILRADLYPDSIRVLFKTEFAAYVESRISYYQAGLDKEKKREASKLTNDIASKIWNRASLLAQNLEFRIASAQMIPALNNMIDIVTTRNAAGDAKVPESILWLLFGLCFISSFLIGYTWEEIKSTRFIIIVFSLMISACIFLIIDLDRPRQGLINMDTANNYIIELRKMFVK